MGGSNMQIVSVQIPKSVLNAIDQLVKRGVYPNRSEVIRAALREFLKKELSSTDYQRKSPPEYVLK